LFFAKLEKNAFPQIPKGRNNEFQVRKPPRKANAKAAKIETGMQKNGKIFLRSNIFFTFDAVNFSIRGNKKTI